MFRFRPLNGESFSKPELKKLYKLAAVDSFRPLNGESFSKQLRQEAQQMLYKRFRPLNGESFSKPGK